MLRMQSSVIFSAFFHVVYRVDTTHRTTAGNRVRVYANGVEQTWHTTNYPTQNQELKFNQSGQPHYIGGTEYFAGHMSQAYQIDGASTWTRDILDSLIRSPILGNLKNIQRNIAIASGTPSVSNGVPDTIANVPFRFPSIGEWISESKILRYDCQVCL